MSLSDNARQIFAALAARTRATRPQLATACDLSKPTVSTGDRRTGSGCARRARRCDPGRDRSLRRPLPARPRIGLRPGRRPGFYPGRLSRREPGWPVARRGPRPTTRRPRAHDPHRDPAAVPQRSVAGSGGRGVRCGLACRRRRRSGRGRSGAGRGGVARHCRPARRSAPRTTSTARPSPSCTTAALGNRATFIYLQVGVGIGAGVVVDGRLLRGANGATGEVARLAYPWADGHGAGHEALEGSARFRRTAAARPRAVVREWTGPAPIPRRCCSSWPSTAIPWPPNWSASTPAKWASWPRPSSRCSIPAC